MDHARRFVNRSLLIVLLSICSLSCAGCETRRVLVRVERIADRMPATDVRVLQQRRDWLLRFGWPKEIDGGHVDAAGEFELRSVRRTDTITIAADDGYTTQYLPPFWPDDELFEPPVSPLFGEPSARSEVYYRLLRERTIEARAAAPDDRRLLIVVPLLPRQVQFANDEYVQNLDEELKKSGMKEPVEYVDLVGVRGDITDRSVALLKAQPLVFAELSWTRITDEGLLELASIPTLKAIEFHTNRFITQRGIDRARTLRPDVVIKGSVMTPVVEIRDDAASALLDVQGNVRQVHLIGEGNTDRGVASLARHSGLRIVTLTRTGLTEVGLSALAELTLVQNIELIDHASISDEGIERAKALRPSTLFIRRR
ncbi:MAG: hypothetical protein WD768_18480 [Phycisphaeraceae bacterium]